MAGGWDETLHAGAFAGTGLRCLISEVNFFHSVLLIPCHCNFVHPRPSFVCFIMLILFALYLHSWHLHNKPGKICMCLKSKHLETSFGNFECEWIWARNNKRYIFHFPFYSILLWMFYILTNDSVTGKEYSFKSVVSSFLKAHNDGFWLYYPSN